MRQKIRQWGVIAVFTLGIHYLLLLLFSWTDGIGFAELIYERLTLPGDAIRYTDIAMNGYVTDGENAINLVFYPLYPLLMRIFSLGSGNFTLAGLIISQFAYALSAILLFELSQAIGAKNEQAWTSVFLFVLYPFSMFAMGVYTEGLFLFLTCTCLLALYQRKYILCGIAGFLAALTRVQGMLLVLPCVCFCILQKQRSKKMLFTLLIPAGFTVYLAVNFALYRNPFQFMKFEAGEPWYQSMKWIGENIRNQYIMASDYAGLKWIIYAPQIILFFFAMAVLFLGIRHKEDLPVLLYGGAYLGFTYLSGWMISGGRYMLCCIPLYLILGKIRSEHIRTFMIALSALLFVVYGFLYLAGFAIM